MRALNRLGVRCEFPVAPEARHKPNPPGAVLVTGPGLSVTLGPRASLRGRAPRSAPKRLLPCGRRRAACPPPSVTPRWGARPARPRAASVPSTAGAASRSAPFSPDERAEVPVGEAEADEVGRRGDRRGAGALVDQGDLAEVVARAQGRALDAADGHGRLAGLDQEERRAARALADDRLALREPALLEQPRDLLDVAPARGRRRAARARAPRRARRPSRCPPACTARHCRR